MIWKILVVTINSFVKHFSVDCFIFLTSATIKIQKQHAINTIIYFYLCFQTFLGIEYLPPIRKILYVYTLVYVYLTQIFPKKGSRFGIPENWCRNKNQYLWDNLCASVQPKQSTFTFLAQIYPKMELGLEIQKTNIEIRINILKIF